MTAHKELTGWGRTAPSGAEVFTPLTPSELAGTVDGAGPRGTLARIQAQAPLLYQHLRLHAREFNPPIPEAAWLTTEVCDDGAQDVIFLAQGCASFCDEHDAGQWLLHHREGAETAIRQLQEKRILLAMTQSGLNRIHDDLDRAFQRILSELRRQQNWRRDRATVTVAVSPAPQPSGQ